MNVADTFRTFDTGVSMKDAIATLRDADPTLSAKRARAAVIKANRSQRRKLGATIADAVLSADHTVKTFSRSVCVRLYNEDETDAASRVPVKKVSKKVKTALAKRDAEIDRIAKEQTKKEIQAILNSANVVFPRKATKLELAAIAVDSTLKG